jgi:hypothetical protein
MNDFGHGHAVHAERTIVRLVRRPDRRQLPTRRAKFRGGRRIADAVEALERSSAAAEETEESVEGRGSAIVMGWPFLRAGHRSTAAAKL